MTKKRHFICTHTWNNPESRKIVIENTKGMTALRVAEAITAQVSGVTAVASKFFGVKVVTDSVGRAILTQEHTLVGGSENLKVSDYDTYFFATGSVGLTLRASDGHLLIDLP